MQGKTCVGSKCGGLQDKQVAYMYFSRQASPCHPALMRPWFRALCSSQCCDPELRFDVAVLTAEMHDMEKIRPQKLRGRGEDAGDGSM